MRTRTERRISDRRAKSTAKTLLLRYGYYTGSAVGYELTKRQIGRYASIHGTCDCSMCTDKRDDMRESTRAKRDDARFYD